MWKTLFAFTLVACFALACESSSGAEGGTSAPSAPMAGDQGNVSPSDGQGTPNEMPPTGEDVSTPTEDPMIALLKEKLPRRYCEKDHPERCYDATTQPLETHPVPGGCTPEAFAWVQFTNIDTGVTNKFGPLCIDPTPSLSLCKFDSQPCPEEMKAVGPIYLGSCAFPGGQTTPNPCTRSEECGGGYCNMAEDTVTIPLEYTVDNGVPWFAATLVSMPTDG